MNLVEETLQFIDFCVGKFHENSMFDIFIISMLEKIITFPDGMLNCFSKMDWITCTKLSGAYQHTELLQFFIFVHTPHPIH